MTRHGHIFVEGEANDDIRRTAAECSLCLDKAHRERADDLPVFVAYKNGAELQVALEAHHCSPDSVVVSVRHKQIIASDVRGDDNGAGRKWLRDHVAPRGVWM